MVSAELEHGASGLQVQHSKKKKKKRKKKL